METAAANLATARHSSLASTTSSLAAVMQAYGIRAGQAANASNVLWTTSTLTGNSLSSVASMTQKLHTQMGDLTPPLSEVGTLMVSWPSTARRGAGPSLRSTPLYVVGETSHGQPERSTGLNTVMAKLPPNLQELAKQYQSGRSGSKQYTDAVEALSPTQATLMSEFSAAATKVQSSKLALDELGISVTNSKGGLAR